MRNSDYTITVILETGTNFIKFGTELYFVAFLKLNSEKFGKWTIKRTI